MRFLVHGTVSAAVDEALRRHGHAAERFNAKDLSPEELLEQCRVKQLDVVTNDAEIARSASGLEKKIDRSIVYLQLAGGDVEQDDAIDRLFARYKRLSPKKLYTVTETRVKVRQM